MSDRTTHSAQTHPSRRARRGGRVAMGALLLASTLVLQQANRAHGEEPAPAAPPPAQPEPAKPADSPAAVEGPDVPKKGGEAEAGEGVTVAKASEARMAEAFAELADSDAAVREEARTRLMGLDRRYLPAFQKLVERSRPLLPSQAAVLRQIVTHVYLAGEPYASDGNFGFLGVRMLNVDVAAAAAAADPGAAAAPPGAPAPPPEGDAGAPAPTRKGVVITERMPGFVGYRMLLDGDVIVGLADEPGFQFDSQEGFSAAVRRVGAGQTVRFDILRRGQLAKVAIKLDPRPEAADPNLHGPMEELVTRRRQKAEAYWDETFGPLLKDRVG